MVRGLDVFREYFAGHAANYVLIGGAACDEHLSEGGLNFRATKDLDIILVVEALDADFVSYFWDFIKTGGYRDKMKSQGERKYYRFQKPDDQKFPHQIELFSRTPDLLDLKDSSHLTPIPVSEELSSLSAILMDDSYYQFTLDNCKIMNGLHLASPAALICLKAKAFLDMMSREDGDNIDKKDISKHKNDIIRLATILTSKDTIFLPQQVHEDMQEFVAWLKNDHPDIKPLLKNLGMPATSLNIDTVISQLKSTFNLRT